MEVQVKNCHHQKALTYSACDYKEGCVWSHGPIFEV